MNNILADTQEYVTRLFKQNNNNKLRYHNIVHTRNVVKAAMLIGGQFNHNGGDINALLVAAWFHDVGYLEGKLNHEEVSKRFARNFLSKKNADETFIRQVEKCIDATKIPQNPTDRLSAALCDADLYHFSQDDFMESTHVFWNELAALNGDEFDEMKYLKRTLEFFGEHQFQTEYGRTLLEPGKRANFKKLKAELKKLETSKN